MLSCNVKALEGIIRWLISHALLAGKYRRRNVSIHNVIAFVLSTTRIIRYKELQAVATNRLCLLLVCSVAMA